ncbi:MAG: VWA domain-containing protein, partial [Clostridia bacterium]|nr:VWA domain-containing protein [Clostridia bacterium]
MSFLYPMGLLGLLGIPILIIIYIIKSKYTEQTIPSTYLWTLSERFLKRRNPLSRLAGIISLILQIAAVLVISLIIAHPVFTVPGGAHEYCFVLDASGSMNLMTEEKTRFEWGKEKIGEIISASTEGSTYSLILVGERADTVFERVSDKEQALFLLGEANVSHTEPDHEDALRKAQTYFSQNPAAKAYFITDAEGEEIKNAELICVAGEEENFAIADVEHKIVDGELTVTGSVTSYTSDHALTVELFIDGAEEPVKSVTVDAKKGEKTVFSITHACKTFASLKLAIAEEDAMSLDNAFIVFDLKNENSYDTLLVSDRPYFIQTALASIGFSKMEVLSTEAYDGQDGYGLYIFDTYAPGEMPRDGAVWLINPTASVPESGFSVQGSVVLEEAGAPELSASSSTMTKKLTEGIGGEGLYFSEYTKCGIYRNFTTLFSYQANPVIFAGTNTYGNREVVFAFDLHKSNLPVLLDFVVLMQNMLEYSFPTVVDRVSYYCGDTLTVNAIANCESIRVDSPLGNVSYPDTGTGVGEMVLNEAGVYTVTMMVGGSPRTFSVFAALP